MGSGMDIGELQQPHWDITGIKDEDWGKYPKMAKLFRFMNY
jgi:hypothetical protein